MKLSLHWLKDYIDPKLSTEALVERLTMTGLEVEGIESVAEDTVLELEITPNRPDCLSILGLAREIGAITGRAVKNPKIRNFKTAALKKLVHIENKKDCSRYIATLIRDVHIKDTSKESSATASWLLWKKSRDSLPAKRQTYFPMLQEMKQRLASLGIPAINNAVDITNFVLMETGQPLHAFDYDKLAGGKIAVRRARPGESIVTLDGIERKLDASVLVIADAQKPVAIAGVMGGQDTQITAGTKNILLESAHFNMGPIRRASRNLGLRSDSSYRFERNVNFEGVLTGANRATDLLLQSTGGKLVGRAQIEVKSTRSSSNIKIKITDIESLLGAKITRLQAKACLARLGFKVRRKAGILMVHAPSHRTDIGQDADVIEEIARMIGFDRLPSKLPTIKTVNIPVDKRPREIKEKIRGALTASGIDEIITISMINTKALIKSNMAQMPAVRVFNPLSQDQELMRPLLLPSFLQVAVTNINRGQKDLRLFEIGKTYFKDGEKETLGILLTGRRTQDWRLPKKDTVEFFDLKGVLERTFLTIGVKAVYETMPLPVFDPACSGAIIVEGPHAGHSQELGKQIGALGKIAAGVLNNWDIKNQDVFYAGFYLDEILSGPKKFVKYQPISEFPAIMRDVSLAVKKDIPYKKVEEICLKQGGDILRSVQFIEQYSGDKVQPGDKALVFSCHYQSNTRTLREDEVSAVHERILQALTRDLSAIRR